MLPKWYILLWLPALGFHLLSSFNNRPFAVNMPNPFNGNEEAAHYLNYLGSQSMVESSVQRLYDEGRKRRQQAVEKVATEVYPPVPTKERTVAEAAAYAAAMLTRHSQQQKADLQRVEKEMYGALPFHTDAKCVTKKELKALVKRVHSDPCALKAKKQQRMLSAMEMNRGTKAAQAAREKQEALKEREKHFRAAVHTPPRRDGKWLTISDTEVLARVASTGATTATDKEKLGSSAKPTPRLNLASPTVKEEFSKLAQPRVKSQKHVFDKSPQFVLYTKSHSRPATAKA